MYSGELLDLQEICYVLHQKLMSHLSVAPVAKMTLWGE